MRTQDDLIRELRERNARLLDELHSVQRYNDWLARLYARTPGDGETDLAIALALQAEFPDRFAGILIEGVRLLATEQTQVTLVVTRLPAAHGRAVAVSVAGDQESQGDGRLYSAGCGL